MTTNGVELQGIGLHVKESDTDIYLGQISNGFTKTDDIENTQTTSEVIVNTADIAKNELNKSQDDDDNVDDDDDDDDEPSNSCLRYMVTWQTSISTLWSRHKRHVKTVVLVVLVLLYFAYFGYALYYEFGDEGSIRLLWVTCLVVFCIIIWAIKKYFGDRILELCDPCLRFFSLHSDAMNWTILAALFTIILIFIIVDVATVSKKPYNLVSLAGLVLYVLIFFIFSSNPAKVKWQTVCWGIALQFVFALIVLRWSFGYEAFKWLGDRVVEFLAYTDAGSEFVFGPTFTDHFFAFKVLPVVIFFSCMVSVLYYMGVMQVVITKVAWVMQITMKTTAGESLNAAGNIFIGQTEAPLMIRPMLAKMTRSEIHAVMTGGFATIAGSTMAAYILLGVPANHLLSASVMSAPAALAMAKLFYPETKKSKTTVNDVQLFEKSGESNAIEAISAGASNAVSLVANIAANLIAFLAILAFINATLTWFGQRVGVEELTFQLICSYVLWPLALIMGVDVPDCRKVAELIGTKTFLNEFIAYEELGVLLYNRGVYDEHVANNGSWYWQGDDIILSSGTNNQTTLVNGIITARSVVISTYALCGFANFSSIGIQLGAFTAMVPNRKADFAAVALRAMLAGTVACFMTACIAGIFFNEDY